MSLLSDALRAVRGEGWIVTRFHGRYFVRQGEAIRDMTLSELIGFGGQRHRGVTPHGEFSIGGRLWAGLSKLIEECGEVCQVAGKLIGARGAENHWDGSFLPTRLEDELADVRAAITFVVEQNQLDAERIERRAQKKLRLFRQWQVEPEKSA